MGAQQVRDELIYWYAGAIKELLSEESETPEAATNAAFLQARQYFRTPDNVRREYIEPFSYFRPSVFAQYEKICEPFTRVAYKRGLIVTEVAFAAANAHATEELVSEVMQDMFEPGEYVKWEMSNVYALSNAEADRWEALRDLGKKSAPPSLDDIALQTIRENSFLTIAKVVEKVWGADTALEMHSLHRAYHPKGKF